MGIPRFYYYITNEFPNVSENISFKSGCKVDIDNLYLDANGILHNCARDIYFNEKPRLSRAKKYTPEELELKLFTAIGDYIEKLFNFVKPKNLFYIAIDGVAPIAKQSQQKSRRYKSAGEKDPATIAIFDTTAITPGTTFMYKLSLYLRYFIRKMKLGKTTVIFSGPDVPGEGEHKIVQYIRENDCSHLTHCMYGLDADLFMLSLGTHCPKFYLLREDVFNTVWDDVLFYLVDIGLLRKEMTAAWGSGDGEVNIINDFIFICFLIGNDFLHALPPFHDLSQSINFIMDKRKEVLGDVYLTCGNTFNIRSLTTLLKELAKNETNLISELFYKQNFPNVTVNTSLIDPKKPRQGIDLEKYRKLYYKKAGVKNIHKFCKEYIQGLEWVQYYYHAKPKNWRWLFPYHYSPLITDIVDYLETGTERLTRVSTISNDPITPFQQLLCVVPPASGQLLPKFLRPLYKGDLAKYCPEKFPLDYEGKRKEWEAIAILPFIDIQTVIRAYNKAVKQGEKEGLKTEFTRNIVGSNLRFKSGKKAYMYKSNYGVIEGCKIHCLTI